MNGDLKVRLKEKIAGRNVLDIRSDDDINMLIDKLNYAVPYAIVDEQLQYSDEESHRGNVSTDLFD